MSDRDSAETPDPILEPTRRMTEQEREAPLAGGETAVWTPAAVAPSLATGQQLAGRFRIVRLLGLGGMGEVYEAEDLELGETVALKTVLPSIARDPEVIERFKREIQLARKVTHPNVCRIFDVFRDRVETEGGKAQEVTFFTMEFLPGETLEQRLRRQGRMSSREAGPIARQIMDGLAAAHQAGVIHRDFKTANVMLVPAPAGDRAAITDFGLARTGGGKAAGGTLTVRGDVLGSPLYMAPEQVTAGEITTATDIYTLGLVLYEMVTGRPPFVGDSVMATMVKRLQEPPPPPLLAVPDLDPAWNDAILRCLEVKPEDRFKDVRDVAAALGGAEVEPGPSRKRLVRRRWLLAAAGLALAVLLAIGLSKLIPGSGKGSVPDSAARLYEEGLAQLRVSEAQESLHSFQQAVALAPEDPLIHLGLAKAYQELGYDREAQQEAKLALDRSGRLPQEEKLQVEAQYQESTGQLQRAIEIYRELVRRFPGRLEHGLALAVLQTRTGRGKDALSTVESLRALPSTDRDDPRLDVAEAAAAASQSNSQRQRELAEKAAEKARRQGARLLVAQALSEQGKAHASTAEFEKALKDFEQARQIYAEAGAEAALAWTLGEQGDVFYYQGEYAKALRLDEEALAVFQRLGCRAGEAAQRNRIGSILARQGESAQALAAWERAVAIRKEIGESAAEPLNNMANQLVAQGELSEARQRYGEALAIFRSTGSRLDEETVLGNLAAVLHAQGELTSSQEMLVQALRIAREVGDQAGVGYLRYELARLLAAQGHMDQAEQEYRDALKLQVDHGDEGAIATSRLALAGLLLEKGDLEQARFLAEQAFEQFRTQMQTEEPKARAVLARVLAAQGAMPRAREEISEAQRLASKIESSELHMTVELAAGQVRAAAGEVAEARRLLTSVRDQAHASGYAGLELEARLELGRLEAKHGDRAKGRALLAEVEKDARARGFGRIVGEARRLGGPAR